jgi:hypothetical protein
VFVVTSSSPEISDLLGLDARVDLMRRTFEWGSRNLKDRQRWSVV